MCECPLRSRLLHPRLTDIDCGEATPESPAYRKDSSVRAAEQLFPDMFEGDLPSYDGVGCPAVPAAVSNALIE